MKAIQYVGFLLGVIMIAAQQLTGQLPQYANYLAIAGTVASAILMSLHHQAQTDDAPAVAALSTAVATLPSGLLSAQGQQMANQAQANALLIGGKS